MMYPDEKERFLKNWEARHKRGKMQYLLRATLGMVALLFATSVLVDLMDHSFTEAIFANLTAKSLISKTTGALIIALLEWHATEKTYRNLNDAG
ncbi:MAG: hypothetical protein IPM98_17280 [Lewinellaceae bacterium]|nr:hypothetical protein [Lewinellaceae bacterium]